MNCNKVETILQQWIQAIQNVHSVQLENRHYGAFLFYWLYMYNLFYFNCTYKILDLFWVTWLQGTDIVQTYIHRIVKSTLGRKIFYSEFCGLLTPIMVLTSILHFRLRSMLLESESAIFDVQPWLQTLPVMFNLWLPQVQGLLFSLGGV